MNVGVVVILFLLVLSLLGIPIYIALGIGTLVALHMADMALIVLPQKLFAGMNSSSLLAIPFFILAGSLMSRRITGKLIDIAKALIGQIKGSQGGVTVLASTLFGAISGSGVATASAIGGITIPAMKKSGYPDDFATAVSSISSILGPIIPPSIPLIVYASVSTVSVASLFIGSVLPGILLACAMTVYCLIYGRKHDLPSYRKSSPREILRAFKNGIWALLMPIIILGGIFGGIFTPTEAAAVGVLYALLVGGVLYRELKLSSIPKILEETLETSAMVTFILAAANIFTWILAVTQLPAKITAMFSSILTTQFSYLIFVTIFLLIVGALIDTGVAVIVMAPIVVPLGYQLGIDPIHLGVLFCTNLAVGYGTPPFGYNLFMAISIGKSDFKSVAKGSLPFLAVQIVALFIIAFCEPLVTWLPNLLKGG